MNGTVWADGVWAADVWEEGVWDAPGEAPAGVIQLTTLQTQSPPLP